MASCLALRVGHSLRNPTARTVTTSFAIGAGQAKLLSTWIMQTSPRLLNGGGQFAQSRSRADLHGARFSATATVNFLIVTGRRNGAFHESK